MNSYYRFILWVPSFDIWKPNYTINLASSHPDNSTFMGPVVAFSDCLSLTIGVAVLSFWFP